MNTDRAVPKIPGPAERAVYTTRESPPGSRAKLLDVIAKAAYDNNRAYEGCSRCVLWALQTHMRRPDDGALRASTAMAGGVARMGETCGALLGGIMFAGQVLAREDLRDFDAYVATMEVAAQIFDRFKREFGTTRCRDIQEERLGRSFDFFKEEDREAWYRRGGLEVCPLVCAEAARLTADVLLPEESGAEVDPSTTL
jgi:C_GCAxxG_C_C family probable redox protein